MWVLYCKSSKAIATVRHTTYRQPDSHLIQHVFSLPKWQTPSAVCWAKFMPSRESSSFLFADLPSSIVSFQIKGWLAIVWAKEARCCKWKWLLIQSDLDFWKSRSWEIKVYFKPAGPAELNLFFQYTWIFFQFVTWIFFRTIPKTWKNPSEKLKKKTQVYWKKIQVCRTWNFSKVWNRP